METVKVVRCPRCGSMNAGSVERVGIEFDRMRCQRCGHEEICDVGQIRLEWNEEVPSPHLRGDVVLPDERFIALWQSLGAEGSSRDALVCLRDAYAEEHRVYHDARHISACLALLDDPAIRATPEVEAAIWFHDAVYDTHANDNEERSAVLAEELLRGVAKERVARIASYILATKHHDAEDHGARLVLDIDLSILGTDPETYDRFETEIRREYAWVDEPLFAAGRAAVLRRFLDRPQIYATALFRERYEQQARENLTRRVATLG